MFEKVSGFLTNLLLLSALFCGVQLIEQERKEKALVEKVFLLVSSTIGLLILIWANDLIAAFLGLEMATLGFYLLISLKRTQNSAVESAVKYFVLGSFASGVLLYGISFIYGSMGTTFLSELVRAEEAANSGLYLVGWLLVFAGFAFKVSLFPFHVWVPDVYQGASGSNASFIATTGKVGFFVALLKVFSLKGGFEIETFLNIVQWLVALTLLMGHFSAILQSNLKRMIAYSSIAHSGYLLMGAIVIGSSGESQAFQSFIFYLTSYVVMTLGVFFIISIFEKNNETSLEIKDLKGLAAKKPGLSLLLAVFLISLAGFPPSLGFFAKFHLFSVALQEGFLWLVFWGVLSSAVSLYYYLRPLIYIYMHEDENRLPAPMLEGRLFKVALFLLSTICLFGGIFSGSIMEVIQRSI